MFNISHFEIMENGFIKNGKGDSQNPLIRESKPPRDPESSAGELNLRILQTLFRFVRDQYGIKEIERIVDNCGLSINQFDGKSHWALHSQVEAFLSEIYELVGDERMFMDACAYKYKESMGPFSFIIKAMSPRKVYELGIKSHGLVSRITHNEILDLGQNHISIKLTNAKKESRLLCLQRQAQMVQLPCLFGLPKATITESSCISKGDEACVYHLKWYEAKRWLPVAAGAVLGVAAAAILTLLGYNGIPVWVSFPILGGLLGYCRELIRTADVNMEISEEMKEALREMAEHDAEARNEMLELHKRQKEWTGLMEEQLTERTDRIEKLFESVRNMQNSRHSALLGFSHDLRNPLNVLRMVNAYLKETYKDMPEEDLEVLDAQDEAVSKMEKLLTELMEMSKSDLGLVKINPEPVQVEGMADQLRKRLRALVFGRDIRTSVFSNREAPDVIETDILVFNRVTDNLLTNAAKYTEQGSIIIELDGRPGFLTIKISDTGRGIAQENIKKIFRRSGSDPNKRARNSYGVGLSVVVQLMHQIGGNIEVMSKPGEGSTFWVHFPVSMPKPDKAVSKDPPSQPIPIDELVRQVVTFREVN